MWITLLIILSAGFLSQPPRLEAASVPLVWDAPLSAAVPPQVSAEPLTGYQIQRCTPPVSPGVAPGPPVDIPAKTVKLVAVDSEETTCMQGQGVRASDANPQTFWHTQYCPTESKLPHQITLDLGMLAPVVGFRYLPRQDTTGYGRIAKYELSVSRNGTDWGTPVSSGTLPNSGKDANTITVPPQAARYVKLTALSEVGGLQLTAAAEITILASPPGCTPVDVSGATVPPGTTTWTDPAAPGGVQCYSVVALYASGRSDPSNIPCPVIVQAQLPAPRQTTLTPTTTTMQVSWQAPVFDATTVPASALTGYRMQRRDTETSPWKVLAGVGPTVLTWTDPAPPQGTPCYLTEAVYGDVGATQGETVCGTLLPLVPTRPAAQNLRVVVP